MEQSTNNDIDMDTQQDYNNMMMGSSVIGDQYSLPTYCSILDQGKEIAWCVQNDSLGLQAVACAFDQILETLRNSKSVSTLDFSDTIGLLHESMYEQRGARSDDIAVPAITKQNTSSASSSRLLSSLERNRNKPTKKQNNTNLDVDHLGIYIPKNRSCGLCGLNGHTRTNCVLKTYGKFLDMQDICKLQTILTNPNALVTEAKMNSKQLVQLFLPTTYVLLFGNVFTYHTINFQSLIQKISVLSVM